MLADHLETAPLLSCEKRVERTQFLATNPSESESAKAPSALVSLTHPSGDPVPNGRSRVRARSELAPAQSKRLSARGLAGFCVCGGKFVRA
jgi:hypothetical protein